ncbi:hypothetical protein K438DRAFT_1778770 [Mycena galopus ATCC 62051]|nr:hypothetical protein K438DRAFT_1778770 [Mycena galopus ATCC 62051]
MLSAPFLPLASLTLSLTLTQVVDIMATLEEIKTGHGARPCVATSLDRARRRCWPTLGSPPPHAQVQPLEQEFKFFIAMNPVGGRITVYEPGKTCAKLSCVQALVRCSKQRTIWITGAKLAWQPTDRDGGGRSAATAAVYSVLCSEKAWHWNTDDGHNLIFYRDGTGEITSWAELNAWIFAIFEGKVNDPATVKYTPTALPLPPSLVQRLVSPSQPPMVPVLRASIEFTLTKRRTPFGVGLPHRLNEELLLDAAFAPRVLNITVERGRFPASWDYVPVQPDIPKSWFQSQLTFDVSPYPVRETWDPKLYDMVDSIGQPNMTKFCAHKLAPGPDRGTFC